MGRNEAGNAAARSAKAKTVSVFGHPVPTWAVKTLAVLLAVEMTFGTWPSALANSLAFAEDDAERIETVGTVDQEEIQADVVAADSAQEEVTAADVDEPAADEAPSASVVGYDGTLAASSKNYNVKVEFGSEAQVPNGAYLTVSELSPKSDAYQDAYDAVAPSSDMGFEAIDITIHEADGKVFEPAASVNVTILRNSLPEGAEAQSDMTVTHIDESTGEAVAQKVAGDNVAGDVIVTADAVKADFTVSSFSIFTLTWGENNEYSATVHYGTLENNEFVEFANDKLPVLDTAASSISLANNFDNYSYVGAEYFAPGSEDAVAIDSTLAKTSSGWEMTQTVVNDDGTTTKEKAIIPNGSTIYAVYSEGAASHPSSEGHDDVQGPTTTKTVIPHDDGTYTIRLDVKGTQSEEVKQVGANVIVVMDITQSMTNRMPGSSDTRMTAAKRALTTLINTLDPDTNLINFTAVNFGNNRNYYSGVDWTTSKSVMQSYVNNLSGNDLGTCWQAGLQGGIDCVGTAPEGNETYVLFVTDGNPNGWVNAQGIYQQRGSGQFIQEAYNAAIPNARTLGGICHFYGIFVGDAEGYNHLEDLVNDQAHGEGVINGRTTSAVESAFENIASTIVENLGSNNVSVDDGITQLSSVSAQVSGEASGYKYYISNDDGASFSKWSDAPGASFSDDNGVTWDLSKVGLLQNKTIYRLEFDLWPSQDALDLIADLNNGLEDYDELDASVKSQIEERDGKYFLLTNTHLKTTYSYNGTVYTDDGNKGDGAMELQVEHFKVHKEWENELDKRDYGDSIDLHVTKDGENYLNVALQSNPDDAEKDWTSDDLYISCGFIQRADDGSYVVKEKGHDYTVTEPEAWSYYWDLTADVYRPMEINGQATLLILDDDPEGVEGTDYYKIEGRNYRVSDNDEIVLEAKNERRSYLNVTKTVTENDGSAISNDDEAKNAEFDFSFQVNNANAESGSADDLSSDYYVYFSIYNGGFVERTVTGAQKEITEDPDKQIDDTGWTGYYYAASGSNITVKMKHGDGLRFINLPKGSTYTVEEEPNANYGFRGASATATKEGTAAQVTDRVAVGTIDKSNTNYAVAYTNYKKVADLTVVKHITGDMADMTKKFTFTVKDSTGKDLAEPFQLGNDKSQVIENVPVGATVTVAETDAAGYVTTYTVTAGEESKSGNGQSAAVEIVGPTTISFTNTMEPIVITGIKKAAKSPITHILVIAVLVATASVAITRSRREQWTE